MRKNIFILALLLLAILPSCKKDEKTTPQGPLNAKFIGTYDLSIDYIFRGTEEEEPSYGSWTGTMDITANGDTNVIVTSSIEIKAGQTLPLYNTIGYVNENGELILDSTEYNNGELIFYLSFSPIKYAEPLAFESEMYVDIYGYPTTYEITNLAIKKQ